MIEYFLINSLLKNRLFLGKKLNKEDTLVIIVTSFLIGLLNIICRLPSIYLVFEIFLLINAITDNKTGYVYRVITISAMITFSIYGLINGIEILYMVIGMSIYTIFYLIKAYKLGDFLGYLAITIYCCSIYSGYECLVKLMISTLITYLFAFILNIGKKNIRMFPYILVGSIILFF